MAHLYKIMTFNVENGSTLGGLISILSIEKPHIVMLQKVTVSSEQLNLTVQKYGYKAETNIDIRNNTTLGTGFLWKSNLPIIDVYSVVECRNQLLKFGYFSFVNIYAPSGSQNEQARRSFFGQDIFRIIRGFDKSVPILTAYYLLVTLKEIMLIRSAQL